MLFEISPFSNRSVFFSSRVADVRICEMETKLTPFSVSILKALHTYRYYKGANERAR